MLKQAGHDRMICHSEKRRLGPLSLLLVLVCRLKRFQQGHRPHHTKSIHHNLNLMQWAADFFHRKSLQIWMMLCKVWCLGNKASSCVGRWKQGLKGHHTLSGCNYNNLLDNIRSQAYITKGRKAIQVFPVPNAYTNAFVVCLYIICILSANCN